MSYANACHFNDMTTADITNKRLGQNPVFSTTGFVSGTLIRIFFPD